MRPASTQPVIDKAAKPKIAPKQQKPSLYNVVMLNDDYTSTSFVEEMLMRHFNKNAEDAYALMMRVHREGAATAGTYAFEIAETKAFAVMDEAKAREYPFRLTVERS